MSRPTLLVPILSALMLGAVFSAAKAQNRAEPAADLQFQRVYAPAGRMSDWPTDKGKYLPLETAEFERLLSLVRSGITNEKGSFAAQTVSAEYRAKFVGEQLLTGRAVLKITHSGKTAAMLPLSPCNAAILKSAWIIQSDSSATTSNKSQQSPEGIAEKSPPFGYDRNGKLQVVVEQSGKLTFDWSLSGRCDASESIAYSFELPSCPTSVLLLDLPENLTPVIDKGVVSLVGSPLDGRRQWRIELGGNNRFNLRLESAGTSKFQTPLALVRESNVYEISQRGLDLSAQWKIQAHDEPLDKISVLLDPGLQLTAANLGDVELSWTIEPLPDDAGTRAVVLLPEPIKNTDCIIRLTSKARINVERPFRLPRAQPEGLFWQEGASTLIVPDPLLVERLTLVNCSQTAINPLAEPRVGESFQFQNFSPDSTIELSLVPRRSATQLIAGTAVEFGSGQITARVAVDFRSDDAAQLTLAADVANSWIIDSVEATPAEMLADWSLEDRPEKQKKLFIRLSKSPSLEKPLQLVIGGRRLRTFLTHQWSVNDLSPLRFTSPVENKRLAAIQAADPYELKLDNAGQLARRNVTDLTPAEFELFIYPPPDLIFEDDAGAAAMQISLQTRKPTYSGAVKVDANVNNNRLLESYSLKCIPESTGINRILVQLSHSRDVPPQWALDSDSGGRLVARQWSKGEQASISLNSSGEIWELTLPRPHSSPFEIRGSREIAVSDSQDVCLASLPEAAVQRGTLVIRNDGKDGLLIDNRRLKPIPPEIASTDQFSNVKATFRFDPSRDVASANDPAIILSMSNKANLPRLWVSDFQLHSWYEPQGSARHLANFQVQNTGGEFLNLALPNGISTDDVHGVWVDDEPIDRHQQGKDASGTVADSKDNTVSVPLPAAKQFSKISIYYASHEPKLRTIGSLTPPLPRIESPLLHGTWIVWLPPGYDVVDKPSLQRTPLKSEVSFSNRFFGPFGRDPGHNVFNPFSPDDWTAFIFNEDRSNITDELPIDISKNPAGCRPADTQGWTVHRLELPTDNAAKGTVSFSQTQKSGQSLKYVHSRSQQFLAAVIFLLSLSLGYWKAEKFPIPFAIITGVVGLSVFVLHDAYVPLASAAILAMLGCMVLIIIRIYRKTDLPVETPEPEHTDESEGSKTGSIARQTGIMLLIVAATACCTGKLLAEETVEKTKPAASPNFRVFVPIDSDKKPVGDKLYLPEKFYNELFRRAAQAKESPQGWLLGSAVYRGVLVRESATGRSTCDAIRASYDLNVFGRMVSVTIPFRRENAQLIPDSAKLDGRFIQPQWETDGSALKFEVDQPGKYRLELAFRPASRDLGSSWGFEMSIPRIAQSRLELTLPDEVPGIEAQSAIETVHTETAPPRYSAVLGPSNLIAVHWHANKSDKLGTAFDADQLTWLKVQSGSVVVDVRFKFHIPEAQVRRLQLAVDPRLRLLPLQGKDAPNVQIVSDGAKQQIITLQWSRPLSGEPTLDLSFLLAGASGVGKFRLPQIELLDVDSPKRWLAISVDPILQYESQRSSGMESAAASDFLKNWGTAAATPLQAYRLENNAADWSLATRPREPDTSVVQTLALNFGQYNLDAYFDAQITVASGYVFQYQLSAPATMKVLRAAVRKEGVEQAARWSQHRDGTITIFLNGPAEGKQQLSLHGTMPAKCDEKTPLPNINLLRASVQSTTLQVFTRPEVKLELTVPDNELIVADEKKNITQKSPPTLIEWESEGITELGALQKILVFKGDTPVQGVVLTTAAPATPAEKIINDDANKTLEIPKTARLAHNDRHASAKICLADVNLAWQNDGSCRGTAIFDLQPGGQKLCQLNVPVDYKIIHLSIDGQSAAPIPIDSEKWNLPLVSERLPQRIEVVFHGTMPNPLQAGPRNIVIPSLVGLPVTQTLLTVTSPPSLELENAKAENAATPIDRQLVRFRSAAAMIASAENVLQSDDTDETLRWYQIQSQYLKEAKSALKNALALSPDSDHIRELLKEIETTDGQQAEFAQRIGLTKVWGRVVTESPESTEPAPRPQQRLDGMDNTVLFLIEGEAPSIVVSYKSIKQDSIGSRIFASIILVAVIIIFILGIRHGTWTTLIKTRPYALGIAAGLAWWCWLWPSFLGFAAVIFFTILWWRTSRNKSTKPQPSPATS